MNNKQTKLLLLVKDTRADKWQRALKKYEKEGIKVVEWGTPEMAGGDIRYALIEPLDELLDKALMVEGIRYLVSVWAGVDVYLARSGELGERKVLRAIGEGLQKGMADYVVGVSLAMVLDLYGMRDRQRAGLWHCGEDRRSVASYEVCVLGMGKMGRIVAEGLRSAGFGVRGYARHKKEIEGIPCFAEDALEDAVRDVDIVVCLLPLNDVTRGVLGANVFRHMARGGFVINAGRGTHVDKSALFAALDSGQLSKAVLDVFENEPLPKDDVYWQRTDVFVTPHVASATIPEDASLEAVNIIKKIEKNPHTAVDELFDKDVVCDMKRGY